MIIIITMLFANVVQAQEDSLIKNLKAHGETLQAQKDNSFREQLINDLKAQYSLSFFSDPMLSIYASSCDEQSASSTNHSLTQICNVVVSSEECKNVKPKEDLLDCSHPQESKSFDTLDFIIGCGKGLWNTVVDFFNFIWTIIKNATDIPEKFMEYVESAKLYLVNEYDKAYEEAESFKTLSAIKAVAFKLGEKVYHAMQEMAQKEYTEFGCLNFSAKTKKICTLLGAFVDPLVLLKTLKLGKFIYRAMTHNEKASRKTLKKARKHLENEARKKLDITRKEMKKRTKEQASKTKELLSRYQKNGDIKDGVIQVGYIGRNGKLSRDWTENINNRYVFTESGSKVPRKQVVSVHYSKEAAKGIAEHQRLLNALNDRHTYNSDITVQYDGYRTNKLFKAYSDGVMVDNGLSFANKQMFVDRRNISSFFHRRRVREPLPVSSRVDSKVSQFRTQFNRKGYTSAVYRLDSDLFVSLDYQGKKRFGVISHQIENEFDQRLEINLIDNESGGFDPVRIDFSDRQTLESIRVSDDAFQQVRQKYSSREKMPMTGNSEKDIFREAFNSGTLTDDVRYIEANGQLLKITSMDKASGTIEVELLESIRQKELSKFKSSSKSPPKLPLQATLFSHYLDDVKISQKAKQYEAETPKKIKKQKERERERERLYDEEERSRGMSIVPFVNN